MYITAFHQLQLYSVEWELSYYHYYQEFVWILLAEW